MIPSRFDYHAPGTLEEAIGLLERHPEDGKVLSGGMSLLPVLKLRLGYSTQLIDINRIPDLDFIRETDGALEIGALAREADLESSPLVADRFPILVDTSRVIADPLVRNRATVCGNIAHADPANDQPATMLALGAEVVALGPGGERTIPIEEFFLGPFMTALEPTEIVTRIRIPLPGPRSGGAYRKLERKVGDFATAGAAAQLTLADDGTVASCGLALTNLSGTSARAADAEAFLTGKEPSAENAGEAGRLAAAASDPAEDWRGDVEYKRAMGRVMMTRAILEAAERAAAD